MAEPIVSVESLGKLVGGMLAGGGVTSIAEAVTQLLILINHLSEDNPAKANKTRREVYNRLMGVIKEIQNAKEQDVSDFVAHFSDIMDSE
jgi:hypothetical protein